MSGLQSVRVRRGEALALHSVRGSIGVVSVHASFRVRTGEVSVLQRIRVHQGGVGLIIFGSVKARRRFYKEFGFVVASHADVLRLVTRSSPRTSAQRTGHFRSLVVSLCFKRTNPLFC